MCRFAKWAGSLRILAVRSKFTRASRAVVQLSKLAASTRQQPPIPMEGSQRIHNKVASFLEDKFIKDTLDSSGI